MERWEDFAGMRGDQKFRQEKKSLRKAQDLVMSIEIIVVGHFRLRAFDFVGID
jgi:hypothetical protein